MSEHRDLHVISILANSGDCKPYSAHAIDVMQIELFQLASMLNIDFFENDWDFWDIWRLLAELQSQANHESAAGPEIVVEGERILRRFHVGLCQVSRVKCLVLLRLEVNVKRKMAQLRSLLR